MASLRPREPYTPAELDQLYPPGLQLQLVQILLRHGERSPVSPRFQNAGLKPHWPYCNAARHMTSTVLSNPGLAQWDRLTWERRLETFGSDDCPVLAAGPKGEVDAICQPGELTDKGRASTLALGQRLRRLYVDQLGFMPQSISNSNMMYLRATPIPRALESVQQAFSGFYPENARTPDFPPPVITTRAPADETLYPNEGNCRRFKELSRAFAQRAADVWNDTEEMAYLTKKLGKWMPESSPKVAVDSKPRLSGIMDTVNATLAHGPETRLPQEFYDQKVLANMDRICVEEWFAGYAESREYRALGIGALLGDIVTRMVDSAAQPGDKRNLKFAMSGCHDTTLAAVLVSLGAFKGEKWPPYTSHIAIELFRSSSPNPRSLTANPDQTPIKPLATAPGWFSRFFSSSTSTPAQLTARTPLAHLPPDSLARFEDTYVRLRYNDRVVAVPGCAKPGNHLEGDESFCTLKAFKEIVDKFTPKNWHAECASGVGKPAFEKLEEAGF